MTTTTSGDKPYTCPCVYGENCPASTKSAPTNLSIIDRFEVIDETGRAYVKGSIYGTPVSVELSYQDEGRTLKVFVRERKTP